jgi:VWFA-related protein
MVYSIGLRGRVPVLVPVGGLPSTTLSKTVWRADSEPDPGLTMLATDSGGRYFELQPQDDLSATFARVADELHRQYEIGYRVPSFDGKLHTIEVKVTRPGLTVRSRRGYVAPKATNGKGK